MIITLTLSEILDRTNDWENFCQIKGYSEWAVNEGGGDIVVSLTLDEAYEFGLLDRS